MSDQPQHPRKEGFDSHECIDLDVGGRSQEITPIPPKVRAELLRLRKLYYPHLPPLPEEPPATAEDAGS